MKKSLKALFAVVMAVVMLSSFVLVGADRGTYAARSAEGWEFQTFDSFGELDIALSDQSFAQFVGTFSGLEGSFYEIVEFAGMMANSRADFGEATRMYTNALIQLEALYTLHLSGVRNADGWIEDTTIDLSPYGNFWIKIDFETGNEYNYSVIDGELVQIEVGFIPNDAETTELRQKLLAPHTIANVRAQYTHGQANMSMSHTPIPNIVQNVTLHPFGSVALLRTTFGDIPQPFYGTAFLVSPFPGATSTRFAVTAGHNIRHPHPLIWNDYNRNPYIILARNQYGGNQGARHTHAVWVDPGWWQNRDIAHDQAILQWSSPFTDVTPLLLRIPPAVESFRIVGYASRYNLGIPVVWPYSVMISMTARNYGGIGLSNTFYYTQADFDTSGISGGPVMNLSNQLYGIHVGPGRGVRMNQPLITMITFLALPPLL